MSKHTKALKARLDEIDAELDRAAKPKKRNRLIDERDEIREELGILKKSPVIDEVILSPEVSEWVEAQVEAAEAGKRHLAHLERVGEIEAERVNYISILEDPNSVKSDRKLAKKRLTPLDAELATLRKATEARTLEVAHETTGRNLKTLGEKSAETDEEIKARVLARRAAREALEGVPVNVTEEDVEALVASDASPDAELERRPEGGQTEQEAGVIHIEDEPVTIQKKAKEKTVTELHAIHVKESLEGTKDGFILVDPEAVQPRDRWGRPEIVRADGTTKGYRRMTTFIDVIDDKDNLVKWKGRVILAGVAATEQKIAGDGDLLTIDEVGTESIIERVEAANQALERVVKGAKKAHKKGKIDEEELQIDLDDAEKAHRHALTDLAEEAFQAGDGYLKAETGTRIHKLTEFVDRGEPLPEDATDSERRDIAAYVAARDALGVEVKLIEQFVVLDDLEVGGTLDRLIRIDSPSLGRRVTAIGDVKTGRMDFGAGKMARQLAGYAKGKTYDWRDPEHVRKPLRANQQVGYIFNVPAGQGVCFVYELDLTLGARGLKLCKEIFDYRAETSTLKKVGTLIHSTKDVTPSP